MLVNLTGLRSDTKLSHGRPSPSTPSNISQTKSLNNFKTAAHVVVFPAAEKVSRYILVV